MANSILTNEIVIDQPVIATPPFENNAQLVAGQTRISGTGSVVLASPQIGGQTAFFTVANDGIFSFGDGSDGLLVTSGDVTLTADKYYTNLTVSATNTFNPAGYRIFCSGTLRVDGTIARNGNNGSNGATGTGGNGGAALADGYLKGSAIGGKGGYLVGGVGSTNAEAGANTSNSIGSNGAAGGAGGAGGGAGAGGSGGSAGTATASNVKLIANWHLSTLLDISSTGSNVKFDNSAGSGGGGWGQQGVGNGNSTGGGGGGGSAGGIVAIYAKNIVISSTGSITTTGGNGGNGSDGPNGGANGGQGGGGGGGGANGGQIILVYNSLANNGSTSVAGGSGGTAGQGGTGTPAGSAGTDGTAGSVGTIRQFKISL